MTIENRDKYLGQLDEWWNRAKVESNTDLGGLTSILTSRATRVYDEIGEIVSLGLTIKKW